MDILLICLSVAVLALIGHGIASDIRWMRLLANAALRHEAERKDWLKVQKDLHDRITAKDIPSYMALKSAADTQKRSISMTDENEAKIAAMNTPVFPRA